MTADATSGTPAALWGAMDRRDNSFYSDRKWCPTCDMYVPYLMSLATSYCVECGNEVRLLSKGDWQAFTDKMEARKTRGGRRRKRSSKSSTPARRESA